MWASKARYQFIVLHKRAALKILPPDCSQQEFLMANANDLALSRTKKQII